MLELPETLSLAKQLNDAVVGERVERVFAPTREHKFCWYGGDPADYHERLYGSTVTGADGFGIFAELSFDNGQKLCINDGVNLRLTDEVPKNHQLAIGLSGGGVLVFTVAMYGGIVVHDGSYDNEYYLKSRGYISPFSPEFEEHYYGVLGAAKPNLSAKALIATEQRFPGIGNGVAQDILFDARLHPKRKLATMDEAKRAELLNSIRSVLTWMVQHGGRDTEKGLYGQPGGYKTLMCKNALATGCPICGGKVVKEAYLGGSVYYCPRCQPI